MTFNEESVWAELPTSTTEAATCSYGRKAFGSCCGINNVAPQANHLQSSLISFYSL